MFFLTGLHEDFLHQDVLVHHYTHYPYKCDYHFDRNLDFHSHFSSIRICYCYAFYGLVIVVLINIVVVVVVVSVIVFVVVAVAVLIYFRVFFLVLLLFRS